MVFQVFISIANCDPSTDARDGRVLMRHHTTNHNHAAIKLDGDLIFGGLFPMHDSGDEMSLCGAIKEEKGIQRLEAMLFAIDMINADYSLLPNISIGESSQSLPSLSSSQHIRDIIVSMIIIWKISYPKTQTKSHNICDAFK